MAHGDAVTAPITAERLAEIEERANAIHAELDHTRTRCSHCDAVNPPVDDHGRHEGCPDADEWPTKVERDGTRLEGAAGLREIAGHMTDLVAEVRRLAAALDAAADGATPITAPTREAFACERCGGRRAVAKMSGPIPCPACVPPVRLPCAYCTEGVSLSTGETCRECDGGVR